LIWFYTKIGEKIGWAEFGALFGAVLWLICFSGYGKQVLHKKWSKILIWFYTKIGEKIGWAEFGALFGAVLWLICFSGYGKQVLHKKWSKILIWFYTKIGEKGALFGAVLWLICQRWRPHEADLYGKQVLHKKWSKIGIEFLPGSAVICIRIVLYIPRIERWYHDRFLIGVLVFQRSNFT
ncbi:hypothetical protein ACJX0J_030123, partial [Zea mays]